jgi:antitoxin component YwqK of YwqJK toxin-antitoxin module
MNRFFAPILTFLFPALIIGETTGRIQWSFKNGKKHGPWIIYHDNGQLQTKGTWKDGKEDGPWVGFLKDGTVNDEYTGTYKNGVKVK